MKIEPLRSGCFQIWLSEQDMRRWGLRFDELSAANAPTRAAIRKLLSVLRTRSPVCSEGCTVEAVPAQDGCLLLFTPHHRLPPPRMPAPQIYGVESANDLLALGERLQNETDLPAASLFGWGDGYRLIVYAGVGSPYRVRAHLSEYAVRVSEGAVAAAFTEEHGTPIAVGDALFLISRGSRPPERRHRAH